MFNHLKPCFMKKVYVCIITAVIVVVSIYVHNRTNNLSTLIYANIEALANTEANETKTCLMVESYGIKQYGYFCLSGTTTESAYQCPPPEVQRGATTRKCY